MKILKFISIAAVVVLLIVGILLFCAMYAVDVVSKEELRAAEECRKELEGDG